MLSSKPWIIRYDDALPVFVDLVVEYLGESALQQHAFLRDADGVLTFVLRGDIDAALRARLEAAVKEKLGSYAASDPLATPASLFDQRLTDAERDQLELIRQGDSYRFVRLIEHGSLVRIGCGEYSQQSPKHRLSWFSPVTKVVWGDRQHLL
jgi:hypothetical protein